MAGYWRVVIRRTPWLNLTFLRQKNDREQERKQGDQLRGNYSRLGEGNGNALQCSCLENPRDRGAWWAAVHGVAQSWTRLKWLGMHACMGEGNGNALQCSCLENPRGRAWWAAVYGVAQSPIRLKRLSSSSSSKAVLDSAWGHENMYGPRHSPALREPCRIFLTQKWGRNSFRVFVSLSLSPKMWLTFSWVKINSSSPVDLFAQLSGPPLALYSPGLCFMKSSRTKHSVLHIGKMFSACVCVCVIFDNLFQ